MPNYMRNLETGDIKAVEQDSTEFAKLKAERAENGRPLYEQTGGHDADPKVQASEYEVTHRSEHDAPIHDVTSDGVAQSARTARKLGQDTPLGDTVAESRTTGKSQKS